MSWSEPDSQAPGGPVHAEETRHERITGPWNGIFIAAYTAQLDGQYYGYAKLCNVPPLDVWSAKALAKVAAAPRSGGAQAMRAAENRALQIINALRAPSSRSYWSTLFQ